jgi:NAD(P)-dependent dehydrogenase (short-subunit alcohol dehydrogenase family)
MTNPPSGRWTAANIPDQSGRIAVVTGANSGVGLETALALAVRGATVVLACRDTGKAADAADQIRAAAPRAELEVVPLDLASMASVRAAAAQLRAKFRRLDLLVNNAAVMAVPQQQTLDGFELTFGTNHLGHFALTGLVLDLLLATPGSRVVTVSSIGHRNGSGTMRFDDLQFRRDYDPWHAYYQSKLANLLFTYELQARLAAAGASPIALASHPGQARTALWRHTSRLTQVLYRPALSPLLFWFAQSAQMGALATLRAATDPSAQGGEYYGPPGRLQCTGYPANVESSEQSHDLQAGRRLWEISEQLTGVSYGTLATSA